MGTSSFSSSDLSDHATWSAMTTIHQATGGQDHDRFDPDDSFAMARMIPGKDNGPGGGDEDISASQKMISAMSGSLLTSLLGKYSFCISIQSPSAHAAHHSYAARCCTSSMAVPNRHPAFGRLFQACDDDQHPEDL